VDEEIQHLQSVRTREEGQPDIHDQPLENGAINITEEHIFPVLPGRVVANLSMAACFSVGIQNLFVSAKFEGD